mgnify:CR=1 FL=1
MRVKDARQTFLGIWVKLILSGQPIEVWGGEQLRDFNYVDDVVDALLRAAVTDACFGNVYNLGDEQRVTLLELAKMVVDSHGSGDYSVHAFPEERKKIDIGDYYSDFSKFRAESGWQPQVSLERGLAQTLDYYRDRLEQYL